MAAGWLVSGWTQVFRTPTQKKFVRRSGAGGPVASNTPQAFAEDEARDPQSGEGGLATSPHSACPSLKILNYLKYYRALSTPRKTARELCRTLRPAYQEHVCAALLTG